MASTRGKIIFCMLAVTALIPTQAFADTFNYASPDECQMAMHKYSSEASTLMGKYEPFSPEWQGFSMLSLFFEGFRSANSVKTTCNNGQCTLTASAGCNFASHIDQPPWSNLLVPILDKEVNVYLLNNKYDPNLTNRGFVITCHYVQDHPIDWNTCTIAQQS